jgi:hypothetical protein
MENTKLSLADFKAKVDKVETNEILEKVQGGKDNDCHFWQGKEAPQPLPADINTL